MKNIILSLLNHPQATEEQAERVFTQHPDKSARVIASLSKAFTKRLFDRYIDHPEHSGNLAESRYFNDWVGKVGFDKALSYPSDAVQSAASRHPDFNNWVDKVGIDKALSHPNDYVQYATTRHPDFNNWVSKIGIDKALSHPNSTVRSAVTNHPDFNR